MVMRRRVRKVKRTLRKGTRKLRLARKVATVGVVRRMLHRGRENKMVSRRIWESTTFNSSITSGDAYAVLPQMDVGTEEYERIGDTVQPKTLYVKGDIGINGTNSPNTKPLIARLLILSQREIKSESNLGAFEYSNLLKVNDPISGVTNKGYDTTPSDNILPVNKSLFTVHYDRKFYLAPTVAGTSTEERTKQKYYFTCKLKCPQNLYFDKSSSNPLLAKNFCPIIVLGYQYADDTGGDIINTRIIANARSFLYYEDA